MLADMEFDEFDNFFGFRRIIALAGFRINCVWKIMQSATDAG